MEAYAESKLIQEGKVLFDVFSVKKIELSCGPRDVVFCNDIALLISQVISERDIKEPLLRISIDQGQESLKMSGAILDKANLDESKIKNTKNGGVKKIFLLAIITNVSESRETVNALYNSVDFGQFQRIICCDMKPSNILCGMTNHASHKPCSHCVWSKDDRWKEVQPRTLEYNRSQHEEFVASDASEAQLKNFANCKYKPILEGNGKILLQIALSQLHCHLGIVNRIYVR